MLYCIYWFETHSNNLAIYGTATTTYNNTNVVGTKNIKRAINIKTNFVFHTKTLLNETGLGGCKG